ncbi:MAG: sulfurtransferase [Pleurocapsa sp. SU_196_0]|nr:sulfurtransferase [Pleurocapsa sp. SU_196_0]
MTPLVSAAWLLEHHADHDLRIVDTRFALGQPDAGRTAFSAGHLPGAVFVDLERDLSAPVRPDRVGGRHPLPEVSKLEVLFSSLGLGNAHHVVAYDDPSSGQGFYAAHLWWLLRYLGHDAVRVLDGGLPAWMAAGGTLETVERAHPAAVFKAHVRPEMIVNASEVLTRGEGTVLVDSRAPERYRGAVEPLDVKAGHIPGAINRNWADGMSGGHWKPADVQRERFADLEAAEEVVVYCGSGVSAAGNLLALELAGVKDAKLYAGSWSDWVSDASRPIATGDDAHRDAL